MKTGTAAATQLEIDKVLTMGATLLVAAVSVVVYLFTVFETKAHVDERVSQIERRLEKIDNKLDLILEASLKK